MNDRLISELRRYAGQPGVTIFEAAEQLQLRIERPELAVALVVPRRALEFFVDVLDPEGVRLIEDWLDYSGYDATPKAKIADEMRADVLTFVGRLVTRRWRIVHDERRLEWESGDRWLQAVPFVPDTEPVGGRA